MRVFFDASVIIAAILSPSGGSALLFQYIKAGNIIGIVSQTVVEEVVEENKVVKLGKSKQDLEQFIAQSGLLVRKHIAIEEITQYEGAIDAQDAHLIAGAMLTRCTHLVTLDKKHLLKPDIQEKFLPLRIVSPKELLEELVG